MRALVQRAADASVTVDGQILGKFAGSGLVVLVGVTHGDDEPTARRLAEKVLTLRIFEGTAGEVSAQDLHLPLLVISQFTLYADTRKGRRPSWDAAAPGAIAEPLVDAFVASLHEVGATVATGAFGADMQVRFTNDGPVTILVELDPLPPR
ncbi:MAG: D-aminoacyl-tRNA deacylase [Candidatus Nanopelagicales bacterium]